MRLPFVLHQLHARHHAQMLLEHGRGHGAGGLAVARVIAARAGLAVLGPQAMHHPFKAVAGKALERLLLPLPSGRLRWVSQCSGDQDSTSAR